MKHKSVGYFLRVHPDAFAAVFGFRNADCRANMLGMMEQLKAEVWGLA